MIRVIIGLLIVLGAVGTDDYALQAGLQAPSLIQTFGLSLVGLMIGYTGVLAMKRRGQI